MAIFQAVAHEATAPERTKNCHHVIATEPASAPAALALRYGRIRPAQAVFTTSLRRSLSDAPLQHTLANVALDEAERLLGRAALATVHGPLKAEFHAVLQNRRPLDRCVECLAIDVAGNYVATSCCGSPENHYLRMGVRPEVVASGFCCVRVSDFSRGWSVRVHLRAAAPNLDRSARVGLYFPLAIFCGTRSRVARRTGHRRDGSSYPARANRRDLSLSVENCKRPGTLRGVGKRRSPARRSASGLLNRAQRGCDSLGAVATHHTEAARHSIANASLRTTFGGAT